MKALLLHNYYTMKQTWLAQLLCYGASTVITILAIYAGQLEKVELFVSLLVSISIYLPMSAVVSDMNSDWMKFLITTPVSRNEIVQSHYFMVLQYQAILLVVNILINFICLFIKTPNTTFSDYAEIAAHLPFIYMQFGIFYNQALKKQDKHPFILFITSGLVTLLYSLGFMVIVSLPSIFLTATVTPSFDEDIFTGILILLSIPFYLFVTCLSYKKSLKIMNEREL